MPQRGQAALCGAPGKRRARGCVSAQLTTAAHRPPDSLSISLSLDFCSPEITTLSLMLFPQCGLQGFTQAEAGPAAPQGHLG